VDGWLAACEGCWGLHAAEKQERRVLWTLHRGNGFFCMSEQEQELPTHLYIDCSLTRFLFSSTLLPLLLCHACSPTGSARQVLSTLSVALPWQAYMSLQKQLMAKGLVRELEVPAEFE
jgi:hypothetical protein